MNIKIGMLKRSEEIFKIIFSLSFLLLSFTRISAQSISEYDVSVIFPNAEIKGALPKMVTGYCLDSYGIPVSADKALNIVSELNKSIFGGMPVAGTLYFYSDYILFKPIWGSSWCGVGFYAFKVPFRDITSAEKADYMTICKQVIVSTKYGRVQFLFSTAKHWYNPLEFYDQDVCNQINKMVSGTLNGK